MNEKLCNDQPSDKQLLAFSFQIQIEAQWRLRFIDEIYLQSSQFIAARLTLWGMFNF